MYSTRFNLFFTDCMKSKTEINDPQNKHELNKDINDVYSKYPYLEEHKEFLGDITENDILGLGTRGIIMDSYMEIYIMQMS